MQELKRPGMLLPSFPGPSKRKEEIVAAELILEFEGVTTREYYAVNKELGIDPDSGEGNWPDGLVAHSAGLNEAGHLVGN